MTKNPLKSVPSVRDSRGRDIQEDPDLYAKSETDEDPHADHLMFHPPWRERLPNGKLGPHYGPETAGAMQRLTNEYHERAGGLAFWDRTQDPRSEKREVQRAVERYDAEKMRRFVERSSHDIPMRELEVYAAFYVDLLTRGRGAIKLGMARRTFDTHLTNLRRRMREARTKDKSPT